MGLNHNDDMVKEMFFDANKGNQWFDNNGNKLMIINIWINIYMLYLSNVTLLYVKKR